MRRLLTTTVLGIVLGQGAAAAPPESVAQPYLELLQRSERLALITRLILQLFQPL